MCVCSLTLSLHQMSVCASVAEIISEGGVRQLYRGGLPEITGLIPRASAALSTLELSRRQFRCV
jgi:solute carrier family 25 2-oxodicarboxylate transporter 21